MQKLRKVYLDCFQEYFLRFTKQPKRFIFKIMNNADGKIINKYLASNALSVFSITSADKK